jgi:predicted nucleic acid-binding protein
MAQNQLIICDTNIIIELLKDNREIKNTCLKIGYNKLSISPITSAEMYFGAFDKKEMAKIDKFLQKFAILPLKEEISSIFAELMKKYCQSHKPFIGDMLIAATALHHEIEIYTLNVKDFQFIPNLRLYQPA